MLGQALRNHPGPPPLPQGPSLSAQRSTASMPHSEGAPSQASSPGLSIENLLSALQRGTVPGADANVAFLCQKYTALLERLAVAEDGERSLEEQCASLDAELRTEEARERLENQELEASAAAAREEAKNLEASLVAARSEETQASQDLSTARAEAEECHQRRMALDEQCASERSRLAEVNSRFRQMQITRPVGQTELRRLQSQLQTLTTQYHTAAEELKSHRERASKENAALAELKSEALSEEESRDRASELAAKHREELNEALGELALLKERLAEAQVGVQRCEDELERRAERRLALQAEIQKYDAWLGNASREMEDLQEVDRSLARVQADTAEVRTSLGLEEAEVRSAEAARELKEAAVEEAERHLRERSERLEAAERDRESLLAEVRKAEEEQSQLEAVIEQLHHDQAAGGGLHRNLEQETQLLLAEAERLRHERDGRLAERSEMLQRLRLLTPALTEARRRVRELEDTLDSTRAEASRERTLAERLEREAGACQDRMRVLRDQNVRLAEQCTELEAQLQDGRAARRNDLTVRARSASATGVRTGAIASERPRSAPRAMGHPTLGSSSARGRTSTPLASRTVARSQGSRGLWRDPLILDRDFEDPALIDVMAASETNAHQWAGADLLRSSSQLTTRPGGTPSDATLEAAVRPTACRAMPSELDLDGLVASHSAGTTPREASLRTQPVPSRTPPTVASADLALVKEWVQNEEQRLGVVPKSGGSS